MILINILIRSLIAIFGLLLVLNVVSIGRGRDLDLAFGSVIALFGIYRLILLKTKKKRYYEADDRD
ncbi:hypothetical protein OAQ99_03395 [Candidatus Kapabacteria bacterium]|nr:hypothetical protein [Candidatus Kapabacteria bacterium]